jgi:Zn-finger nucleic acid-binding protein
MNFMDEIQNGDERVELKYCERCGGIFLRKPGAEKVFCMLCSVHVARQFAVEEMREHSLQTSRPRKVLKRKVRVNTGGIRCLQGVASMEVRV